MNATVNKPAKQARHVRISRGDRIFNIIAVTTVVLLTIIVLLPMLNVVSASFSASSAVSAGRVLLLPVEPTLDNYKTILDYKSVWLGYRNTIFYTVAGTLINIALTLICAYPLSQRTFSGRKFLSFVFFVPMVFSGGMIPSYMLMRDLRLLNTVWAVLLPGGISMYNMIVARTFLQNSIPEDLLDAARIDGCDDFRYFFSIILPLSKAIIAVLALWYAVGHWNAYFNAFLYLKDQKLYPLQIFLKDVLVSNQFSSEDMMDPETIVAMQNRKLLLKYSLIVVSTAPLFFFYPFVQKYFVKGVMIGSVKG